MVSHKAKSDLQTVFTNSSDKELNDYKENAKAIELQEIVSNKVTGDIRTMSNSDTKEKVLNGHNGKAIDIEAAASELDPMIDRGQQDETDNTNDAESDDTTNKGPVPIDRGWAWMVLLGATLEMTIVIGILKTSGIFFVNFQNRFNSTSSMTSLISTVQNGVYSVGALLVMTVGMKFLQGRTFNMIGGTLLCICYIISSRAEDIRVLLFSHGVLQGLGIACMQPIALTMVGSYFDKRRGFANSIAVSGGSLGGLILAPLLTTLFQNYGFSGAMLIVSSFFLHGWVTGALFRPQTFYTKRHQAVKSTYDDVKTYAEGNNVTKLPIKNGEVYMNGNSGKPHVLKRQDTVNLPHSPSSPMSIVSIKEIWVANTRKRAQTFSESDAVRQTPGSPTFRRLKSQMDKPHTGSTLSVFIDKIFTSKPGKFASSEYIAGSLIDIPFTTEPESESDSMSDNKSKGCAKFFKTLVKVFDFSLFKNPVFVGFIVAAGLLCASSALSTVYIAPHAKENGIDASGVATFLTIYSAIDLCSRIIVGLISDKGWLRRSTLIGVSAAVIGVTAHLLRFYTSYNWFLFYAVVLGLFSGVHFSLFAVVIVDYLTLAKLQSCLGFTTLFHGGCVSLTFALIGILRDNTGSYVVPFHLMGTMALVGGSLMASLPLIEKFSKRNKQPRGIL